MKPKKCRGTGKAKGFGCEHVTIIHKFGLCISCFKEWLFGSDSGKEYLQKTSLKAQRQVKVKENKKKEEKRVEIMSTDKYRKTYVQPIINEIARLIDYGCPCIATGSHTGKANGGHYYSIGSNRTLALNLHNIHIQSEHSNTYNNGDGRRYLDGLKKVYGEDYAEFVTTLKQTEPIKLTKDDLMCIKTVAEKIRNELKKNPVHREPVERIKLRNEVNERLGIYKEMFPV